MSFWVRSQDKKNLVVVDRFVIAGNKIKGYSQLTPLGITLGKYSSKERARAMLDTLQSKISSAPGLHIFYEMPREM
ncbi:MAG: hypothetical protein KAT34_09880 [Candidatus Aminicenantes bacterium]|jgi:hypothetical protein|nr:hypothetical protein [Candidatus Aminicenantes bacterium]